MSPPEPKHTQNCMRFFSLNTSPTVFFPLFRPATSPFQLVTAWRTSSSHFIPNHLSPRALSSSNSCFPLTKSPPIKRTFTHFLFIQIFSVTMAASASIYYFLTLLLLCAIPFTFSELVKEQPLVLKYHNGPLLKGKITVNLIWYGKFSPTQRSIIVDFINSLSSAVKPKIPSASFWWKTTEKYKSGSSTLVVGKQILLENYPLGKILKNPHLPALAGKFNGVGTVSVILTAKDVAVDGFCMRCGTHGSNRVGRVRGTFIWVGNSETQCPGQCAWPFHQPIYGPQTPPLVAPNGDVGIDGMIITLATLLANTVTNPFNNGYFQGPADAPLEAVSACTGIFGTGSYPGYPGKLLVEKSTGASYNANGVNGRKYLLPAMWDPQTSRCKTLV
ncbi:hypothetical protein ERO13_A13G068600v2 [Gossypium hirsutum]|uniref:Protein EXORDIUM-like 2 n=1 Tax=Gossypium hirsutum TaxID=3635 RepID=A0A1U8KW67_GOSHI|nr:protein EXORDIUM-like 2 [Gossypium hirsutum]KAG4165268.1 hypothetical protein ERO13_A13G068600v2 [Gossypium hirsutum]